MAQRTVRRGQRGRPGGCAVDQAVDRGVRREPTTSRGSSARCKQLRENPVAQAIDRLYDGTAFFRYKIVGQRFIDRDFLGGRKRFFAIEVHVGDPGREFFGRTAENAPRESRHAGFIQKTARHFRTGRDAAACELFPHRRKIGKEIKRTLRRQDFRAGLFQPAGELLSQRAQNAAAVFEVGFDLAALSKRTHGRVLNRRAGRCKRLACDSGHCFPKPLQSLRKNKKAENRQTNSSMPKRVTTP